MCGRYIILNGRKLFATTELLRHLEQQNIPYLDLPRYNAAPAQKLPIVVNRQGTIRTLEALWWLIPHWSKDGKPDMKFASFNARSEGIRESRLYSKYFAARRCLVPADGFYEWKRINAKEKHPVCIRMQDEHAFFFAGVYSIWTNKDTGEEIPSFSIITTLPNELMSAIHTRMPVILPERHFEPWLDPAYSDTEALHKLLLPYPAEEMKAYRVSSYVSNARNEGEACMAPLEEK